MTTRRSLWASLFISGVVLLPGCVSLGTYQVYPGEKLPDDQTALIKRGPGIRVWYVDGKSIPDEEFGILPLGPPILSNRWERNAVRVLPGMHEMKVGWQPSHRLTFEAEAGEKYRFLKRTVADKVYLWMEKKPGSVIAGEKPPPG